MALTIESRLIGLSGSAAAKLGDVVGTRPREAAPRSPRPSRRVVSPSTSSRSRSRSSSALPADGLRPSHPTGAATVSDAQQRLRLRDVSLPESFRLRGIRNRPAELRKMTARARCLAGGGSLPVEEQQSARDRPAPDFRSGAGPGDCIRTSWPTARRVKSTARRLFRRRRRAAGSARDGDDPSGNRRSNPHRRSHYAHNVRGSSIKATRCGPAEIVCVMTLG